MLPVPDPDPSRPLRRPSQRATSSPLDAPVGAVVDGTRGHGMCTSRLQEVALKLDTHVRTTHSGYSTIKPLRRVMRNTVGGVYRLAKARGMDLAATEVI